MAYIIPNGKIQLMNNLRLDSSYEHTYHFDSLAAQSSFFAGKVVQSFTNQSYSRKQKDLYVNIKADSIYNCNYLRFQNTSFGSKWFYAFITEIEYISNDVSKISFEIDVVQTWFFDFDMNGNFVERSHTASDDLFEHIEPDISPFGDDYVFTKRVEKNYSNLKACVQATSNPAGLIAGITRNNVYSQLHVIKNISITDETELNKIVNEDYSGRVDAIINIFEYPEFLNNATTNSPASENYNFTADTVVLDSYTIKNKKCLCYPYNYLIVSNNQGANTSLRFEDFANAAQNTFGFTVIGALFPTPEMMCYPRSHKGIANDYEHGTPLNNFPTCCFSGNAYTNYLAQHQNSIAISNISAIGETIAGGVNPASILNTLKSGATYYANQMDMRHLPASAKGHLNSVGLTAALNRYGFNFYQKCLNQSNMKMVDNFFTKYGYAINRIWNNIRTDVRPYFTYIKLNNAAIYGNVPAQDCRKLESIHNNGITYWKSNATIGDYTVNNSPT